MELTMQPDGREAAITRVEYRIEIAVQRGADERCKNCVANEDKITTNTIEVLRSEMEMNGAHALHLHVTLHLRRLHYLSSTSLTTCSCDQLVPALVLTTKVRTTQE